MQVDDFVQHFFIERGRATQHGDRGNVWHHFLSWYPHRADPNCLFLFDEDLVQVCLRPRLPHSTTTAFSILSPLHCCISLPSFQGVPRACRLAPAHICMQHAYMSIPCAAVCIGHHSDSTMMATPPASLHRTHAAQTQVAQLHEQISGA